LEETIFFSVLTTKKIVCRGEKGSFCNKFLSLYLMRFEGFKSAMLIPFDKVEKATQKKSERNDVESFLNVLGG
jgi:hypothetical protein